MTTVRNRKGVEFKVTFEKTFKTSYGLEFRLLDYHDDRVEVFKSYPFFASPLLCHYLNVGCAIFVINEMHEFNGQLPCYPTDNEYDLDEIYMMIEKGECV